MLHSFIITSVNELTGDFDATLSVEGFVSEDLARVSLLAYSINNTSTYAEACIKDGSSMFSASTNFFNSYVYIDGLGGGGVSRI